MGAPDPDDVQDHLVLRHADTNGAGQNGYHEREPRVAVLIIGGGPTGLLQAHLLSRLGGWLHTSRSLCWV